MAKENKYTIGLVGFGFIGKAVAHGFALHADIKIYDKYDNQYDTLNDTVNSSDFIFIGVPTPMKDDGTQDLSSIYDAVKSVVDVAKSRKIIILKSTIIPGTTRKCAKKYKKHGFVFCPEFLTERASKLDFINSARIILGGKKKDMTKVEELYRKKFTHTPIYKTTWEAAEVVKYMSNSFFAIKISFLNEMYEVAKHIGVPYEELRDMWLADQRIGNSHTDIPGHDGQRGYGGKCLVVGTKLISENYEIVNNEDIEIGDKIFDGISFTTVTAVDSRTVDSTIGVTSRGRFLQGSKDHLHLIYDNEKLVKKEFKDLTLDDWVFVPKQPELINSIDVCLGKKPNNYIKIWEDVLNVDNGFARLIGLYLAEGFCGVYGGKHEVYWTFGEDEEALANEVCNILVDRFGLNSYKKLQISNGTYGVSRCWVVRCRSIWLYRVFEELGLGIGAHSKNSPIIHSVIAENLIGGWLDGDGSYYDGTVEGYSRSKDLIMKIDSMLLSLGINAQISSGGEEIKVSTRKDVERICKWVNKFQFNGSRYETDIYYESPTMKEVNGGWITKINKVEELPGQKVISIETESRVYVANNVLVHNCFPKDVPAFINWGAAKGLPLNMCRAAERVNDRVREIKDWLDIKGATSKNDYEL